MHYTSDVKEFWQLGAKKYHKDTLANKNKSDIYWEGKHQEGGFLCLGEKQQRTEQNSRLNIVSCHVACEWDFSG